MAKVEKCIFDLAYFGYEPIVELHGELDESILDYYSRRVGASIRKRLERWKNAFVK